MCVKKSALVKLVATCLMIGSVFGYENVYDLLERRNQKRYHEPHLQRYQTYMNYDDRARYYNRYENPYLVYERPAVSSKFGNGYDNIGNGVPGHFHPFQDRRNDNWNFNQHRPPYRRPYNDHFRSTVLRTPFRHQEDSYSREHLRPKFDDRYRTASRVYGNDFGVSENTKVSKTDHLFEDNEGKKQKKTDEIYQRSNEGLTMNSSKREKAGEVSHTDQNGENKSSIRSNKVVKKGHTTKGFASHHHKDETGNSTTFFDELTDFGGQSDFRDINDGFDTRKTLEHITNTGDEKFYKENGGQAGNYGSGLLIDNQKFEKDFMSAGQHSEGGAKINKDQENEEIGIRKDFRYLNGEKFDFSEPYPDTYY